MESIVVFCGSSDGYDETYREMAYALGTALALRKIRLIYGGSKLGLMGAVADGALEHGGEVIGVIPTFLQTKEITHTGLTRLILVNSMHERKVTMHELSDGVITLPGGWGTMDEMFEMLTWAQLGMHQKPIAILNVNGYYESLKALTDNMVSEGFLKESLNNILLSSEEIDDLLEQMDNYVAPDVKKWITGKTS